MSSNMPGTIFQNTSVSWTDTVPDYPADQGWTLKYSLFNASLAKTFTSSASGSEHAFSLMPADTAALDPGRYDWTAYVENASGTERHVIWTGVVKVQADPASATPQDLRTHARKMLDAIEAALEGRATAQQLDLVRAALNGRAIEQSSERLLVLRDKYRAEVAAEERAQAIANGEQVANRLKVRF